MQEHAIPQKELNTINKWARGAVARRRLKKLILTK